jgi:hypothetical protein
MDNAQRGMGLDWCAASELIRRAVTESRGVPGARIACGVGTDQLEPAATTSLDEVIAAYEAQPGFVEQLGGRAILMASRALARVARSAEDHEAVYGRLLGQGREPVILHWLGSMFDPALLGYWGSDSFEPAAATVLRIIGAHATKVEGIKISLLDKAKEIALRRRLPTGILMFTGDDFHYPELKAGDSAAHSHALLGILDAIAVPAARSGPTSGYWGRPSSTTPGSSSSLGSTVSSAIS